MNAVKVMLHLHLALCRLSQSARATPCRPLAGCYRAWAGLQAPQQLAAGPSSQRLCSWQVCNVQLISVLRRGRACRCSAAGLPALPARQQRRSLHRRIET